jgi:hypothetical protein
MADPVVNLTAAPIIKMAVGMNYPIPWNAYGFYFGGGHTPGTEPNLDAWLPNLSSNLIQLRDTLNIRIVRIFLLCNAFNYGSGTNDAFQPPASLHPKFTDHLTGMLQAFKDNQMKVIPSLIDFKAFGDAAAGGGGCMNRFKIATDDATRETFFSQVLDPFLTTSAGFKDQIFAWEVMNEPFWNTSRIAGHFAPGVAGGRTVSDDQMKTFLSGALNLIENVHGFKGTVGHRFSTDLADFPTGKRRQFHFYHKAKQFRVMPGLFPPVFFLLSPSPPPTFEIDDQLPPFSETQAFVGEFATSASESLPWKELNGADAGDTRTRVFERLKFLQEKGYPLALVWPDGPSATPDQVVDPLKLTAEAQQGIIDFQSL